MDFWFGDCHLLLESSQPLLHIFFRFVLSFLLLLEFQITLFANFLIVFGCSVMCRVFPPPSFFFISFFLLFSCVFQFGEFLLIYLQAHRLFFVHVQFTDECIEVILYFSYSVFFISSIIFGFLLRISIFFLHHLSVLACDLLSLH